MKPKEIESIITGYYEQHYVNKVVYVDEFDIFLKKKHKLLKHFFQEERKYFDILMHL